MKNTNDVIDISWFNLSMASFFVLTTLAVSWYESLKLEKQILLGSFRATVQLIFVGFLITAIFELNDWYYSLPILGIMIFVASQTLYKRLKDPGTYLFSLLAVSLASILTLFFLSKVILGITPWYEPRYLIPLAGMVIANGMNSAALAGERYKSELVLRLSEIEMLLALGYDSQKASQTTRQKALNSALIPALNNMMVIGIVSLPGMMTGQILVGVDPFIAVKYQLIILLAITSSISLMSFILIKLLASKFFTKNHQIRYDLIKTNNNRK